MSFRLSDGSNFRLKDQQNKDVTASSKIDPAKVTLQIDIDKDGKFDGEKDISIKDQVQLKNILDKDNSNNESIKEIPFVDEIASQLSKNSEINSLLEYADKKGKESNNTSIIHMDLKIELGKTAFTSVKKSFDLNPSNSEAKFAYGMALLKIQQSTFSGTAEKKMEINLATSIKNICEHLEKDKFDILNQLLLRELYSETKNSNKKNVEKTLGGLKNSSPVEYSIAETRLKKVMNE